MRFNGLKLLVLVSQEGKKKWNLIEWTIPAVLLPCHRLSQVCVFGVRERNFPFVCDQTTRGNDALVVEKVNSKSCVSCTWPHSFCKRKKTHAQRWIRAPYLTVVVLIYLSGCTVATWADRAGSETHLALLFMWTQVCASWLQSADGGWVSRGKFCLCHKSPKNPPIKWV